MDPSAIPEPLVNPDVDPELESGNKDPAKNAETEADSEAKEDRFMDTGETGRFQNESSENSISDGMEVLISTSRRSNPQLETSGRIDSPKSKDNDVIQLDLIVEKEIPLIPIGNGPLKEYKKEKGSVSDRLESSSSYLPNGDGDTLSGNKNKEDQTQAIEILLDREDIETDLTTGSEKKEKKPLFHPGMTKKSC